MTRTNSTCNHSSSSFSTPPQCTVAKGKTWRSLDLTQHPPPSSLSPSTTTTGLLSINCNPSTPHSPSSHQLMLTPNTISNLAKIGGGGGHSPLNPSYYYEQPLPQASSNSRLDFKNRRSSSEPVQDLLANASHGSCLINALQQHQQQTQPQQPQQPQQQPNPSHEDSHHQIVCGVLKVRTLRDVPLMLLWGGFPDDHADADDDLLPWMKLRYRFSILYSFHSFTCYTVSSVYDQPVVALLCPTDNSIGRRELYNHSSSSTIRVHRSLARTHDHCQGRTTGTPDCGQPNPPRIS